MISLRVTDIKQFMYCRRIIYFTYCQPVKKKDTYKMKFGSEQHDLVKQLEKRRTLKRYGIEEGEKIFKCQLFSKKYKLSGRLDLLIETERDLIPIELKYSTKEPRINHKFQLAAYMLLLEEKRKTGIRRGLIHTIPNKKTYSYNNSDKLRNKVKNILNEIRELIREEFFPAKPRGWKKCKECEYKKYCGDVG